MSHSYYIPTYDECREICDANGNLTFYESKHVVDGYNVSIFNYRLAMPPLFEAPVPGKSMKAHEMRGLTFVFNPDGTLFKRYLLMDKFFNINQAACSMYDVVKNYTIKSVTNKEDGSISSFIRLPNKKIVARSKTAFESDQAIEVNKILDTNSKLSEFLNWCFDNDIMPIFEYVSPKNRVVLKYPKTDLVLLLMRNNNTGEYYNLSDFEDKFGGLSIVQFYKYNHIDELMNQQLTTENIEGWVVQFTNGKMVKVKVKWYCDLHGIFTEDINRENTLIEYIIDEKIDDILSQLGGDPEKTAEVDAVEEVINNYILKSSAEVNELMKDFNGSLKDFSLKYVKHKWFPVAIGVARGSDLVDLLKDKIKKDTKHLMAAREWLTKNRK